MYNVTIYKMRIFVSKGWVLEWILPRVLTDLPVTSCQGHQNMHLRPYFIKMTAKL